MKKKRIGTLFLVSGVMTFFLLLPGLVGANVVPWETEEYIASVGSMTATRDTQYGPPLPISAEFDHYITSDFVANSARSTITGTTMDVYAFSWDSNYTIWGEAKLLGTYTASAAYPLFQFTYDGYYSSIDPGYISEHYAWLTVTDLSTSTVLYNSSSLTLDNNSYTIEVPTIAGSKISVEFGTKVTASRLFDGQTESLTLNYSTAVAPEPISSILFLAGGGLMAGRRLLKRGRS